MWKRIKCFFGCNSLTVVAETKCIMEMGNMIGMSETVNGIAQIYRCDNCKKEFGIVTEGLKEQSIDPAYLRQWLTDFK